LLTVCADAENTKAEPSSTEILLLGERLIWPGKSGVPGLAPPPQPLMLHRERIATADTKTFERDLPMHPSLNIAPAQRFRNTPSERSNELENL
jgi:hypothetical protein